MASPWPTSIKWTESDVPTGGSGMQPVKAVAIRKRSTNMFFNFFISLPSKGF
jgi:hypothetical protein